METHSFPTAAPSQANPNACGHSAFAPPAAVEGDRGNLRLPTWARSTECRLLLSLIEADRPERTRVLTEMFDGTAADLGYAGRHASKLRAIWERTYLSLLDWASAAPDREGFDRRREAVIAYAKQFGPDALIARLLGDDR